MISHIPPYRLIFTKNKEGERTAILLPRPLAVTGKKFLGCSLDGSFHNDRISYLETQFNILWDKAYPPTPEQITGGEAQNAKQLQGSTANTLEVSTPSETLKV